MRHHIHAILLTVALLFSVSASPAQQPTTRPGDQMLADYFRNETTALKDRCLADIKTRQDWDAKKSEYRRELAEMLGLWPTPPKTDLQPVVTGTIESEEFTVERLQFQSMPHLYVTGDLYLPKNLTQLAPAILYVCGHSKVKENGVSLGNKTFYQHHGEWFARNGYVCLIIDSLELGEIEGIHHGNYNLGMWWWQSRGYTPAGVEAWNGIRAIDYLCSRREVDPNRIGMTGRSGGGAYTWYVAALDERVKVACPVAGMTDLQNYVVDGCIEGHCDCMFMDNTYRWDFPQVATLISPRPLLIGNSDKDEIFPLDGVYRLHEQVRRIYKLQGADQNLGLLVTEGPHKDTQDLQVPVFRWFNRFLKNDTGTVDKVATKFFEPKQLRVFDQLPADQINTKIQETFGPSASPPAVPTSAEEWSKQRDLWMAQLKAKTFAGWPDSAPPLDVRLIGSADAGGMHLARFRFVSEHDTDLDLFIAQPAGKLATDLDLVVLDEPTWADLSVDGDFKGFPDVHQAAAFWSVIAAQKEVTAWFAPRGVGPTAWTNDPKKQTQIRRRFALLGQTLDGMRVWDVCRAVQTIRTIAGLEKVRINLSGEGRAAGIALYVSLFEPHIARLDLTKLPASHRDGPDLLNVLQVLDMPQALAMATERVEVRLHQVKAEDWNYPVATLKQLGWPASHLKVD